MKILMCIVFWTDNKPDSTRDRNAKYCWNELKKLSGYLLSQGINCEAKIYDFSPTKIIEDSIHIPYGKDEFKKAEKMNLVITQNEDFDYLIMFDADCFFIEEDYKILKNILFNLSPMDMITFDCAKLFDVPTKIDKINTDWWFAYAGEKKNGPLANGMKGGFGGVFIVDMKILLYVGKFNEEFKYWGGEDNEIISRIYSTYHETEYNHIGIREIFPFHLPHFVDLENENYRKI